jgi:hypothetical protein
MAWQYNEPGVLYDQAGVEYNGGIMGAILAAVDWVVRARRRGTR